MKVTDIIKQQLASLGVADDQIDAATEEIEKAIGEVHTADELKAAVEDAVAKAEEKAKAEFDDAVEKAVAAKVEEDKADPVEKMKEGLSDEARERFEKMEAEAKANAERIEKMEAERRTEDLRKRAVEFSSIAKADDIVEVWKGCDDETVERIETLLKAAAETVKEADKVLTKSIGTSTPGEGTALAEMNAKADEIAKANNLTHQQAFARVAKEHPDLLRRHRAEQAEN